MSEECCTIDFETEAIRPRPAYPPVPVGVSIRYPTGKFQYLAWGHPIENNCDKETARSILENIWSSARHSLIFHNSKFDLDVAETHLGLAMPPWYKIHDTLYLLFLFNPHALSRSLKQAAQSVLGMPPDEQEELRDWVLDNVPGAKNRKTRWEEHIAKAPGRLVGKYANGDSHRTFKLFQHCHKYVREMDMLSAYDRERKVMPILLKNERQGIRVDLKRLEQDVVIYESEFNRVSRCLEKRLQVPLEIDSEDLNLDSDRQVADRLDHLGIVDDWVLTSSGQKSMAKNNLTIDMFKDRKVALAYAYRTRLGTCLSTFMDNWLNMAYETDGIIHTN